MNKTLKVFGISSDGETKYLRFTRAKVNIPPYGIMTPDEVVAKKDALRMILEKGLPVFEPATEKEYNAYEAEQAKIQEQEAAKKAEAEKEKVAPEVAAYQEELKAEKEKVGTLTKELEKERGFVKKLQEKISDFQKTPDEKPEPAKAGDQKPKSK